MSGPASNPGTPEHVEDGGCWCESFTGRVAALDRLWPDRCDEVTGEGTPNPPGLRLCTEPAGHAGPYRSTLERRGGPCHFCAARYAGEQCPVCWTSLEGMALPDLKALFAGAGLSLELPKPNGTG